MKAFIGIDVGTSTVKTAIFDSEGHTYSIARKSIDISVPRAGYAEQEPEMWWKAVKETITEALNRSGINQADLCAVGLSGQMHGAVMLDAAGNSIRPAISWCDQRSAEQVNHIKDLAGNGLGKYTLNTASTGFQLVSLMWLHQYCPEDYQRIKYVIAPKDYIRYKLTGHIGTERTDASATLAFDTTHDKWCDELINLAGIDGSMFPEVAQPHSVAGFISRSVSLETGLREGITVVYGGADQAMQAVGNGIICPGDASLTIGTGGQLVAPLATPLADLQLRTNTFCGAPEGSWYIMGATLSAGLSLKWFTKQVLKNSNYRELDNMAMKVKPGCGGLMFMPYLGGERTPHMNSSLKGSFWGLTLCHTDVDMYRAVMEGVAYSIRDCMSVFENLDINAEYLLAAGGGTQSSVWTGILADVLGKELRLTGVEEQACLGAAITAAVGYGEFTDYASACSMMIPNSIRSVVPDYKNHAIYTEHYETYKNWYKANQAL